MTKISDMTTAEMLAEYNALTGKTVTKFASRARGEAQLENARKDAESRATARAVEKAAADARATKRAEQPARSEAAKAAANAAVAKAVGLAPTPQSVKAARAAKEPKPARASGSCPSCDATDNQETKLRGHDLDETTECGICGVLYFTDGTPLEDSKPVKLRAPKTTAERAASAVKSWSAPDVRAARAARHAVVVGNQRFKSVREAFAALDLPDSKHIAFRGKLKKEKALTFEHNGKAFAFTLVTD